MVSPPGGTELAVPGHLLEDIVTARAGGVELGPYQLTWQSEQRSVGAKRNGWSRFELRSQGEISICEIEALCPPTPLVRAGIDASLDGRRIRIERNGPRLLAGQRRTRIVGEGRHWEARGSLNGSLILDVTSGALIGRTRGRASEVAAELPLADTTLLLGLILNQIPQAMSLFFARI
jgi:hypothetical protein